jgi:hypothetical protein
MLNGLDEIPESNAEIIVVGGKSFAFGLRWTSAAAHSTLEQEAKAAAIAEDANYVVIHRAYNQFGIGSIPDAPTGIRGWFYRPRSGVATIALAAGVATLAAFPLEDERWLVLVIDKRGIFPDGDMIVPTAEKAKARIDELIAQSPTTWRKKFLPDAWGIPDSKSISPKDLLSRSGAARLTPLWFLTNRRLLRAGLAAAAILFAVGVFVAAKYATSPPPVVLIPFQLPKPLEAFWTPAAVSLDRCFAEIDNARRYNALPGWSLTKYTCTAGKSVVIDFSRIGNGQISAIRGFLPMAQLSDDGRSASLTIPLPPQPRVSATGPFTKRQDYQAIGLDVAQRLNGVFALQAGKKLLPGETDTSTIGLPWKQYSWTYQTQAPPVIWASAIELLGAISVETLIHIPADDGWQLTGNIYAHP